MLGVLNRERVRGLIRQVGDTALRSTPLGRTPLVNLVDQLIDRVADRYSQIPCAIADLILMPIQSNCAESASPGVVVPDGIKAPRGSRLGVFDGNTLFTTFYGPGQPRYTDTLDWSYRVESPARHRSPGASFDGQPILVNGVATSKRVSVFVGTEEIKTGTYDNKYTFKLMDANGNILAGSAFDNFPRDGLTDNAYADIQTILREGLEGIPGANGTDPCACFDPKSDFWKNLKKALESLLRGESGDPDDEKDPEDEEEDEEKDKDCKSKGELAQLYLMVKKLHTFMGGTEFGDDRCNPKDTKYKVNPEELIRAFTAKGYDFQVEDGRISSISSQEIEVETLPQLLASLMAVGYTRSGQFRYPSSAPKSIVDVDKNFFGNLLDFFADKNVNLTDQQSFYQWWFEQDDARLGKWQQTIEIPDTDLEEQGNQSKKIVLPNISEGIATLFEAAYDSKITNDALLNMLTRVSLEVCTIKAKSFQVEAIADSIVDYLGYKVKEEKKKLPLLFTLKAPEGQNLSEADIKARNNLANLLEVSEKDIPLIMIDQAENYQQDVNAIRQTLAILRAVHTKSFGSQVAGIAGETAKLLLDLRREFNTGQEEVDEAGNQTGDWSAFLNDVEMGFTGESGISDTTKPYGRPLEERPRIREIGRGEADS